MKGRRHPSRCWPASAYGGSFFQEAGHSGLSTDKPPQSFVGQLPFWFDSKSAIVSTCWPGQSFDLLEGIRR
jgi:hypothetical protein